MKKRFISTVLCAAMAASLVTGCGSGSGNASGGSTQAAADTGSKKEVVIWDYFETDAQKAMMTTLLDGFNASQDEYVASHVYVPFSDYEKQLTLGIASGELPDLVILDGCSMASFISLGLFGDISDADIKWDEYIAGPMESTMADGRHYGIPFATNCTALFYNKDMFDAAGVAYPEDGWTMEDLADWGQAFAKGEGANKTYGLVKHWVMNNVMVNACGGTPYSDDLSTSHMGTPEIVDSLTLYKKLIDTGVIPDDTAQKTIPAETLFVSGKSAMYPCGGFETITVTNDADENGINIGFCKMPSDKNGKEINVQYATGWAITTTSKNPDAGWQFLKESAYANDEMAKQTAICGMPSNKNVAESYYADITFKGEGLNNSYYVEHMGNTHLNPFGGTLASTGNIWTTMVEAVLLDNQDPQAVVVQYAPQIEKEFAGYSFNKK